MLFVFKKKKNEAERTWRNIKRKLLVVLQTMTESERIMSINNTEWVTPESILFQTILINKLANGYAVSYWHINRRKTVR